MFKHLYIPTIALILSACASQNSINTVNNGHTFSTGVSQEKALEAVVHTVTQEGLSIDLINEKFGIVNTGMQKVLAAKVQKWRNSTTSGLGSTTWKVSMQFSINQNGEVTLKYCHLGAGFVTAEECITHGAEEVASYFETQTLLNIQP